MAASAKHPHAPLCFGERRVSPVFRFHPVPKCSFLAGVSTQCPTYDRRLVTIKRAPIPGVADQPSDYRTSAHACSRTLCLLASDVEMLTCTSCLSKTEWLRAGPWNTHALSQSPRQTSLIISNKPCFVGYSIQWRRSLRRLLPHFSSRSKYCQG